MNQEDIIRMAREAGFDQHNMYATFTCSLMDIERFFKVAYAAGATAEREALEEMDWTWLMRQGGLVTWDDAETLGDRVIAAIRARSKE